MSRLSGKVALVSGTARGQGRAAALRFAAEVAEAALVIGGPPHTTMPWSAGRKWLKRSTGTSSISRRRSRPYLPTCDVDWYGRAN
ncbi:hypothetical protein [Streptomyces sp. H27-C3]|uniref:hypothetical protein n=1 Tax=Streptomyces sp. H27-C3 TaxID=3046305 RepID=UPI0024BAF375|nr:hypothetical protein [Streptomyces sp. H27-C3]MDJ0465377.1 hypothetical protein [Streptomyces sp. H27-C3]